MAVISLDILIPPDTLPTSAQPLQNIMSRWARGNFLSGDVGMRSAEDSSTATAARTTVFRGRSGGNYVYSVGTPPAGATDVVVISLI